MVIWITSTRYSAQWCPERTNTPTRITKWGETSWDDRCFTILLCRWIASWLTWVWPSGEQTSRPTQKITCASTWWCSCCMRSMRLACRPSWTRMCLNSPTSSHIVYPRKLWNEWWYAATIHKSWVGLHIILGLATWTETSQSDLSVEGWLLRSHTPRVDWFGRKEDADAKIPQPEWFVCLHHPLSWSEGICFPQFVAFFVTSHPHEKFEFHPAPYSSQVPLAGILHDSVGASRWYGHGERGEGQETDQVDLLPSHRR